MSIISSSYEVDNYTQIDGRRYVTEIHIDSTGQEHRFYYLADVGADYNTIMSSRILDLEKELATKEFEAIINGS
jgi:hypothetical protein